MMRSVAKLAYVAAVANAAVVHVPYDIAMSVWPAPASCEATDSSANPAPDCATGFSGDNATSCPTGCTYTAAKGFTADPHFDTPIDATVGDTLHIMWTDPETVPPSNTADGQYSTMIHDVTGMTAEQFETCNFQGLTPMTTVVEPGDADCELTAGTDCSTTDARCLYTAPVADNTTTATDETVAEACTPRPRWKAVSVELTEAGTRYFSCSIGSAANMLMPCGTSDTPACAEQPWAHCSVLNQKVTVNVAAAAGPDKASSAATVGVTMAAALAAATVL